MDEASVALKLEGKGKEDEALVAVGGAGVAAGMRIASTCIEVPRFRLHSMRQWRKSRRGLGRQAAMGCNFRDLHEGILAMKRKVDRRGAWMRQRLPGAARQNQPIQFRRFQSR